MAKRSVRTARMAKRSVWLIVIIAVILTTVLSFRWFSLHKENQVLSRNIEVLTENVSRAEEEQEALEEKRSHPLSKEDMIRIAREKFNLVFPNEIILVPED